MTPMRFRFASAVLLVFASCAGLASDAPTPPRAPNVVVLLADDQGWADLAINGNTNARTPNLDSLARAGAKFDRFYVCPVCAPTRAEFLTGRYHPRTGVSGVDSGRERMNPTEKTIADTFKAAGYATGHFGKWHNGGQGPFHPNARGFDEFYGFTAGHWGWYFDAPLERNGQPVRGRGYIADDLTDHAMSFMAENRTRPFLCYVALNTPHSPFSVPDAYWDRWKEAPLTQRAPEGAREDVNTTRAVLAMNENLDWNVGRILEQLTKLGVADDTIVVYFSDNGPNTPRWNAGMKGRKGSVDEGGVRSPLFIRWPHRIAAGMTVKEIAGAIDLHPTLAQLAGAARVGSKPLDGVDLSPLLLGQNGDWPERMIFSSWAGRFGVRTPRHRLDDRGALFDLVADPGQQSDVATTQPEIAARLRAAVANWSKEMFGDNPPTAPRPAAAGQRAVVVDARPIPVGHSVHPITLLPAGEGMPGGGVQRSNRFPNCTYFTNWKSVDDTMTWDIDVLTAGTYEVVIDYACPAPAGSKVEASFGNARLSAAIQPAWDPPLRNEEDRVARQESFLKDFRPLTLGSMQLTEGRGNLVLRATEIRGEQAAEVYQISLRLMPEK